MPVGKVRKNRKQNLGMIEAIHMAGGQVKLGQRLGIPQSYVSKMLNDQPSHRQALWVSEVMGVPRGLLRPDIWGHELDPETREAAIRGALYRQPAYVFRAP
jgi:DNA-binding transcriptional regulator YdaS (Cro superfamily)